MGVIVKDIAYYLPENTETNSDLLKDNPDWDILKIETKTGIKKRRVVAPDECASDLAVKATEKLLANSGFSRSKIDMLIFCTQSPDYFLPTTACLIQDRLKLRKTTGSFDINLGCSAYIYGLAVASSMIKSGLCENALLLCADTYTKFIKNDDRTCRPLFGDAAAATLLVSSKESPGLGKFVFGTDGSGSDKLIVTNGAMRNRGEPQLKMDGASLFMFTLSEVPDCIKGLLDKSGKKMEEIDLFVFHQANKFIIQNIAGKLSIPERKVFMGFEDIGNTVSASVPIALKQANEAGMLHMGSQVLLAGFGVGYSWGACLLDWSV